MFRTLTGKLAIPVFMALAASAGYASPITLTVDNSSTTTHYQQTKDDPCIFGGNDCQPASGFPTETSIAVGGNVSTVGPVVFDVTAGAIRGLIGGTFGNVFMIGVDLNVANGAPINISQLEVWDTTANTELAFLPSGTSLTTFANGTGFTDALLSHVDLGSTSITPNADNIQFRLTYSGATDGTDSFFLISTSAPPPVVPEPVTSALVGTGLVGLFFVRRHRAAR
jgi:hypothetical protein